MARKVVSRKRLREEADAAEKVEVKKKKKAVKKKKKKAAKKRTTKAPNATEVRMKLFWGVFNQSLKRVALYEFNQKKQAQAKVDALNAAGKTPHFVQKVKELVDLDEE